MRWGQVTHMTATEPRKTVPGQRAAEVDRPLYEAWRSAPPGSAARERACEALVRRYEFLVRLCAQQYRTSPVAQEELMQVGYVGLLKAINRFDPAVGVSLGAYAEPCIAGEIKRYFRDKRWQVHVRRAAQDLRLELRARRAELAQRLARQPAESEVARYAGLSDAELREAQRAEQAFEGSSLDATFPDGLTLAERLGEEDPGLEFTLDMAAVWTHWPELPEREQRLLLMRFYGELTQAEIGERLGMSQMQVSRLLRRALGHLRERLLGRDEPPAGRRPAC